jgi:hypothetical protein
LCAVAVLCTAAASADVFYAVSNYSNGSAGVVTRSRSNGRNGQYAVQKDLVSNFGVDAAGFTFRDPAGRERAMIREYNYGPNDTVYVWDPEDWKTPLANVKDWGSNIHAAASVGKYLYLATYESYAGEPGGEDAGEVARVDMKNGYARDKAYRYERHAENGHRVSPHAEDIHIGEGGEIYVLYGMPYNGVTRYEASEIVEFDRDLNVLRKVRLKDSEGNAARNAVTMSEFGGKLYVAAMGGYQGPDSWGDIWEVDIEAMTAKQILDGHDLPYIVNGESVNVGMYGVDFAADGTAFVLAGSYGGDYSFRARLFVTTAARLAAGDAGTVTGEYTSSPGYSWGVLWDEAASTLWCMTGRTLEARDGAGNFLRAFAPSELGDNVYSISLLNDYKGGGDQGGDREDDSAGESGDGGSGGGCTGGVFVPALFAVPLRRALTTKIRPWMFRRERGLAGKM